MWISIVLVTMALVGLIALLAVLDRRKTRKDRDRHWKAAAAPPGRNKKKTGVVHTAKGGSYSGANRIGSRNCRSSLVPIVDSTDLHEDDDWDDAMEDETSHEESCPETDIYRDPPVFHSEPPQYGSPTLPDVPEIPSTSAPYDDSPSYGGDSGGDSFGGGGDFGGGDY